MNTDLTRDQSLIGRLCNFVVQIRKMSLDPNVRLLRVYQRRILWSTWVEGISYTKMERGFKKDEIALIVDCVTEDNSIRTLIRYYDYILFYDNKFWAAKRSDLSII